MCRFCEDDEDLRDDLDELDYLYDDPFYLGDWDDDLDDDHDFDDDDDDDDELDDLWWGDEFDAFFPRFH